MSLAVIVPTRGRPQNVAELLEAWVETTTVAELHLMVDDDDPTAAATQAMTFPARVTLWLEARRRLGGSLNWLAPTLAQRFDAVGFMGDDHRPRTLGWDSRIGDEATRPGAVVYGNDLNQQHRLPTAVFLDARIVRAQGFMVPVGMVHLYLDDYWKLLGERLGTLRYLPDVVIEHMHPTVGKAQWDGLYAEVNAAELYEADRALLDRYVTDRMDADLALIRAGL